MLLRIATAAVLIPLVVALVWWGPPEALAAGAAGVALVAMWEFFTLGERMGMVGFRKWTMACGAGILLAQYAAGTVETHSLAGGSVLMRGGALSAVTIEMVLLVFIFGVASIGLATRRPVQDVLPAIAISSAGLVFVALPFSYLVRVNQIEAATQAGARAGRELVLFTLCMIWAGDIAAYFIGRSLGRMPMAPVLSPKKTWEGAIANFVASLLVAVFFARLIQVETVNLLVIAALANIAGQAGDLTKSVYKRGAVVKDSGTLLPGHGGVLDRIDSLILAAPVVWVAWNFMAGR